MTRFEIIDAPTLKSWLDRKEAILIDVRELPEYKEAHIPGSILIPVKNCFPDSLPQNPDKKIVFHCKSGMRSGSACDLCARQLEGRQFYNLDGGIAAWIKAGYEVVSA
ncbi:MAG: rhodanese-like domain-containing protein [Rhodospirillales bacterium]|nr:rhodanese-like domain-containing protein [Rhodospirillales bacterium]MCB9965932.1 rhodanese-like domain-containing protein [Rhodospirillales bacterium]